MRNIFTMISLLSSKNTRSVNEFDLNRLDARLIFRDLQHFKNILTNIFKVKQ